jgi:hypothetical protein
MKRKKQLLERFHELGFKPDSGKIALIDLVIALEPSEVVLQAIDASYQTTIGLLVATEKRIVYAGASFIKESVTETIDFTSISGIDFSQSPIPSGDIIFTHSGKKTTIAACSPDDAKSFIVKAKQIMGQVRGSALGQATA